MKRKRVKVVIGVIGSDCHAIGNMIIQNTLESGGFKVINVGTLSQQEDFIGAAAQEKADAIIISSLYGHGEAECRKMRKNCEDAGLENILLYIGGNLIEDDEAWTTVEKKYKEMGFNRVYKPGIPIEQMNVDLKKDLNIVE